MDVNKGGLGFGSGKHGHDTEPCADACPPGHPAIGLPGSAGGTCEAEACCVAVYRAAIAGSRMWVGPEFMDSKASMGVVTFAPAGHPKPHPFDREVLAYPYGEFCTSDKRLICRLDEILQQGGAHTFYRVENPQPMV